MIETSRYNYSRATAVIMKHGAQELGGGVTTSIVCVAGEMHRPPMGSPYRVEPGRVIMQVSGEPAAVRQVRQWHTNVLAIVDGRAPMPTEPRLRTFVEGVSRVNAEDVALWRSWITARQDWGRWNAERQERISGRYPLASL
jgi:hypothetical protein